MPLSIAWPGRSARGSLVLPLPWSFVPPLAPTLALPEATLARKDELHLTVLSTAEARAAADVVPEADWQPWFERHDWTPRLTDRWFLLRAGDRPDSAHTVIAELECEALNTFRRDFGYAAATTLEATLPHVTLWMAGTGTGIGIASTAQFHERCVRPLTARERQAGIDVD